MCGLVGFSGPKDKHFNLDKIRLLLMMNQDRGKDSHGFYTPGIGLIKELGRIEDTLMKKDFHIPGSHLLIAHVRASTVGATNKANAHPFNYGNIVLAMNGTLTNHWDLCREYGLPLNDYDVDSQIVAAIIAKEQNKNVLGKVLGACALIYTDTNTGRVYCYRNSERPLYRGNYLGTMYMSSIENSLKIIGCTEVKEFKADNLYEISEGAVIGTYKIKRAVPKETSVNKSDIEATSEGIFLNVQFGKMRSEELIGKWLTPKNIHAFQHNAPFGFKAGWSYEVLSATDKEYNIVVHNHGGQSVEVSKYIFEEKFPIITHGDYVFAKDTLTYEDIKKGSFCETNDLMIVLKRDKEKITVKNIFNEKSGTIDVEDVRFAYSKELAHFKEIYGLPTGNTFPEHPNNTKLLHEVPKEKKQKSETEVFEDEIKKVNFKTFEDLATFTTQNIEEVITDLKEIEMSKNIGEKVKKIEIVIDNFNTRVVEDNLI